MYVWGHSYEFDNDNNWELMEKFGAYIGAIRTFGIVRTLSLSITPRHSKG